MLILTNLFKYGFVEMFNNSVFNIFAGSGRFKKGAKEGMIISKILYFSV